MDGISVIIPCYNREAFLQETVQSAVSQEYAGPIEILVVDDGSTDRSIDIASSFGPPVAVAIAYAVHTSVTFAVTQHVFHVSYDWRAVAIGLGAAVGLYFASQTLEMGIASMLFKCGLWLSWPILLWCLGIVNTEEKAWGLRNLARARCYASSFLPGTNSP